MDDKILRLVSVLQKDVDMMLERPTPKNGRDGQAGTDGQDGSRGDAGRDGTDGRDGQNGADGRDGRDGTSANAEDVATLVQSRIRVPEDGVQGVQGAQGAQGKIGAQGEVGPAGPTGRRGAQGPPGKSITGVKLNKNKLSVAIEGKFKTVGEIDFEEVMRGALRPAGGPGGGGGTGYRSTRLDALGWDGQYVPGKTVPELTAVHDDGWAMVSNRTTDERAAPQPTGSQKQLFNGILVPEQDTAKQILFGLRVTVEQAGYISSYRVDTVAGNEYQVFLVDDPLGTPIITQLVTFTAATTGWNEFNIETVLLVPGATFEVVALVNEPDPTPTTFNGDWDYRKPGGGGGVTQPPLSGEIVHPNNAREIFRVHKTDDLGGDRSAELATLTVGDIIEGQGIRWSIQGIVDDGAYYSYEVAPAAQAQDQGVTNFVFETVTATPITFGRDAGYWDSIGAANIRGVLAIDEDYADADILPDAFGVDLKVQAASISDHWDLLAVSSSAGGGGSSPTGLCHITIANFETTATQSPTGLGDANKIVINYGAGGNSDGDEFTIAANGEILANPQSAGLEYRYIITTRIGREGGAGVAQPMLRFMYAPDGVPANAVQVGGTFAVEIDDGDTIWREVFDVPFSPAEGSIVFIELARSNGSNDSGGLLANQPSGDMTGWNPVSTARIQILRVDLV